MQKPPALVISGTIIVAAVIVALIIGPLIISSKESSEIEKIRLNERFQNVYKEIDELKAMVRGLYREPKKHESLATTAPAASGLLFPPMNLAPAPPSSQALPRFDLGATAGGPEFHHVAGVIAIGSGIPQGVLLKAIYTKLRRIDQ